MKFTSSIIIAAAANGVFGAAVPAVPAVPEVPAVPAVPAVPGNVKVDTSIVGTVVGDVATVGAAVAGNAVAAAAGTVTAATGIVASLVGVAAPVLPGLGMLQQDLAKYLGFINFNLPKVDLSIIDSLTIVKTAQVIVDDTGVTKVYNLAIERVAETTTTVTGKTIAGPAVTDVLATLKGINVQSTLAYFQRIAAVLPTNVNVDSIFAIVVPQGLTLNQYLGVVSTVEGTVTNALKEIQVVRLINGKLVNLTVSFRLVGVSVTKAWGVDISI